MLKLLTSLKLFSPVAKKKISTDGGFVYKCEQEAVERTLHFSSSSSVSLVKVSHIILHLENKTAQILKIPKCFLYQDMATDELHVLRYLGGVFLCSLVCK